MLKAINDGPENAEIKESKKKQAVAKIVPPTDGNATEFAQWAVIKLKSQNPPVLVGGEKVQFETGSPQVAHSFIWKSAEPSMSLGTV